MSTNIYLIRHGESEGNKRRAFLGHTDLDLTDTGHNQAQNTAEFLKDIDADVIYSSDLRRAYSTALHTAEMKKLDIIKSKNLREIYAGDWENGLFSDLEESFKESYAVWLNNIGRAKCDGGESVEELQIRVVDEITHIAKENDGKTILIFTHATPIRVFKAFCDGCSLDEIKDIRWATNASVTKARYADGRFEILEYGIDYFQGNDKTVLPANV